MVLGCRVFGRVVSFSGEGFGLVWFDLVDPNIGETLGSQVKENRKQY